MSNELIAIVIVGGVGTLILHLKTHLKFIILGLYVGVVLSESVAQPLYDWLAGHWSLFHQPASFNLVQLFLLLIPTICLGFNHSMDKKHWSLGKTLLFVAATSLLLLSSVLEFLPPAWRASLIARSEIIFRLSQLYVPLLVGGAILIIVESFHHKKSIKKSQAENTKT